MNLKQVYISFLIIAITSCSYGSANNKKAEQTTMNNTKTELATFGEGCFWCVEAIFQQVNGVINVTIGYMGGTTLNPTYKEVCTGKTGHAEVCLIKYDPKTISYKDLLEIFWKTHDPTTPNRQGMDIGTQYRSVIFYYNKEQKELAEEYKAKLNAADIYDSPAVTEISPAANFYPAESYHQDYFNNNPGQAYCQFTIVPKLEKFKKIFKSKLRK